MMMSTVTVVVVVTVTVRVRMLPEGKGNAWRIESHLGAC